MKIAAPAKINLTLEVLNRQDDGYHALRSVMVPLALADELTVERAERFEFHCDDATLAGNDNLAVRAAHAVSTNAPVAISLTKRIPTQAGLGGGSSDAAGVLRAAMRGAFGVIPPVDWLSIARGLGSDVPFFLVESGALVEATGERVTAVGSLPAWHVLVVKPPAAVPTVEAYAELDRALRPSRPRSASVSLEMVEALQRREFSHVQSLLSNDFHDVIALSVPEVACALGALKQAGAQRPLLSGSGSAVFALAESAEEIARVDEQLHLPASYKRFRTAFDQSGTWRE
jgi:4-diphosphocytidyl-2-C-methyl-D-erythritol kinase